MKKIPLHYKTRITYDITHQRSKKEIETLQAHGPSYPLLSGKLERPAFAKENSSRTSRHPSQIGAAATPSPTYMKNLGSLLIAARKLFLSRPRARFTPSRTNTVNRANLRETARFIATVEQIFRHRRAQAHHHRPHSTHTQAHVYI